VLFSLALVPLADLGWIYLVVAIVSGALLMTESVRVMFQPERAMKLFTYSTVYLTVLFGALFVDGLLA
jgi:heme o synthase